MMTILSFLRWTLVLLLLFAVSSCSLFPKKPPPDVMATWNRTLESMGMLAVVPFREDVRVGDLFVYPVDPTSGVRIAGVPRWGSLPLLEALRDEYRSRRPWPKTPMAEDDGSWPAATSDGSLFTPTEGTSRLRSVALDPNSSFRFKGVDLPGLLPTEIVASALGDQWDEEVDLVIKVSAADGYGLSSSQLLTKLIEPSEAGGSILRSPYRTNLHFAVAPYSDSVFLLVAGEVLYLRSLDVVAKAPDVWLGERVSSDELDERSEIAAEQEDDAEEGEEDHSLDPIYAAFARAHAINELMMEVDADDTPASFVRFLSVTEDSIALRRTWQHGLAIGMKGFLLEVEAKTGVVRSVKPVPTWRPPLAEKK